MARPRIRTDRLGGNQQKLDELEFFIEGIGRFLFGEEGEDFRKLGRYVPRTRNLSALLTLAQASGGAKDPAEDLQYLHAELERRSGRGAPASDAAQRGEAGFFRYRRYAALLDSPEQLLDRVEPAQRLAVAGRLSRGLAFVGPVLARMNAYAWLGVVGMPDLEAELTATAPGTLTLEQAAPEAALGLEEILASVRGKLTEGLREYFGAAYRELSEDYRSQLARLAAKTERLG